MKRWLVIVMACAGLNAAGDTTSATDYFNLGAATFIRENPEAAKAIVDEGLLFHPDDEPLLKLKALLEQQQNSQSNQSDSSDPSDSEQDQDQDQNQDQDRDQDQDQDQPGEPQDQPPQDEPQDQPRADEMTDEEAEMVLDSLRQLEEAQRDQLMQEMIRRQMRDMPPVEKDW